MNRLLIAILLVSICEAQEKAAPKPLKNPPIQDQTPPKTSQNPPPFDADLFRRDAQVFSLHGEFLYWRVQEGCLDYALVMDTPAANSSLNYAQGRSITQAWNGDPGFRIAASFFRAPKFWEIRWEYTRMTARGYSHIHKPTPAENYLTGTWPQILPVLSGAKSRIHMNYNVFDTLIDRFFNPNPHMRLRLIAAGSLAWIDQDWVVEYFGGGTDSTTTQNKWSYIAGGIKTGMMVDWFWFYDIYMTLKALAGGYIGTYDNSSKQETNYSASGLNTDIPFRNMKYNDVRASFAFQIQMGPSWQRSNSASRIEVFAGYELNGWFNLHEVYRSSAGTPSAAKETYINTSMMALQGLTSRITVDF